MPTTASMSLASIFSNTAYEAHVMNTETTDDDKDTAVMNKAVNEVKRIIAAETSFQKKNDDKIVVAFLKYIKAFSSMHDLLDCDLLTRFKKAGTSPITNTNKKKGKGKGSQVKIRSESKKMSDAKNNETTRLETAKLYLETYYGKLENEYTLISFQNGKLYNLAINAFISAITVPTPTDSMYYRLKRVCQVVPFVLAGLNSNVLFTRATASNFYTFQADYLLSEDDPLIELATSFNEMYCYKRGDIIYICIKKFDGSLCQRKEEFHYDTKNSNSDSNSNISSLTATINTKELKRLLLEHCEEVKAILLIVEQNTSQEVFAKVKANVKLAKFYEEYSGNDDDARMLLGNL